MSGTYWTSKKQATGSNSTITLVTTSTIPANTSISVTLYEATGNGANTDAIGNTYENSASVSLAGGTDESNDLTGFDGGGLTNDYWCQIQIDGDGTDPTLDSPTITKADAQLSTASFSGTVTDSNSNTIQGATVRAINASDWTLTGTDTTDSSGNYSISAPDTTTQHHLIMKYEDGSGNKYNALSKPYVTAVSN